MTSGILFRYLLGQSAAIRSVAESRAALPTGIALVFITTMPRNYDQTFILEAPTKWLFGNLAFSLVSGTWLYLVAYACTARLKATDREGNRPRFWGGWPAFMGLFWFTAPIAWFYAIPVERMFDDLNAARANLLLLGLVSVWRVALMIRVLHVISRAPVIAVTFWVLTAAFAETLLVTFFSGMFAKSIMAGMAGMRHSPAEEILMSALGKVFVVSLFGFPVAAVAGAIAFALLKKPLAGMTKRVAGTVPRRPLLVITLIWTAVSVPSQRQAGNSARLEELVRDGEYGKAIAFMAVHQPHDFAPSRPLPPKAYEYEIFEQLPGLMSAVTTNHPGWVRRHLLLRTDQFSSHFKPWSIDHAADSEQWADRIANLRYTDITNHIELVTNLARFPEGLTWIRTNSTYIPGLEAFARREAVLDDHARTITNLTGQIRRPPRHPQ